VSRGYVVLAGNVTANDGGGGGTFMPGTIGQTCTTDHGIVFQDTIGNCFYRSEPTFSVREWGALRDVVGEPGNADRNLLVEGFGIPEGYGYFGLVEGTMSPSGYVGPTGSPYVPIAARLLAVDPVG
jgi:hypothetical protein